MYHDRRHFGLSPTREPCGHRNPFDKIRRYCRYHNLCVGSKCFTSERGRDDAEDIRMELRGGAVLHRQVRGRPLPRHLRGSATGVYDRPDQAATQFAGGHTFKLGDGIDTSHLGIPADRRDWRDLS